MSEATVTQPAAGPSRPARSLDLLYGETETELRAAVRDVLEDKAPWRDVLARTETAETYDTALWRTLAEGVGLAGLLIPEEHGGAGASYREAAVVAEEIGRAVAPVPFLGSAVVATAALLSAGDTGLLGELASGAVTATLAVPFAAGPSALPPATVRLEGSQPGDAPDAYRLTGQVRGVADALPADVILVPADGVPYGLYAVQAGGGGVGKAPVVSLDQTRQLADLTFDGAPARRDCRREAGRGRGDGRAAGRRRRARVRAVRPGRARAGDYRRLRQGTASSSPARSADSRPSSTGSPTCGSRSARRGPSPGQRPTGSASRTRPSPR